MKHTHNIHGRPAIAKTLTHKDDVHFLAYIEVMAVLGKFWPERFTTTEYLVLNFIVNRTLIFRKRAEIITRKHFTDGIQSARGAICSGVGVSETARTKAINSLCDQNFIHVHCFLDGKVESVPRIYELNCEQIVQGYDVGEIQNMLKRSRKLTREPVEIDDFDREIPPTTFRGEGPPDLGGLTELLHSSKKTSFNKEESAAPQPILRVGKKSVQRAINSTPTPVTGDARERLAQMQADSTQKREQRVSTSRTVPSRKWDIKDLQALLDTARAQAGVAVPRVMATAKGAGVLHKRMKEAEIKDSLEFFTWAFANWGTVASANRRAKAKQTRESASTEMSMIPNFSELAYRFPYILAFFNDRVYGELQTKQQAVREKTEAGAKKDTMQAAIDNRRERVRQQDLANREAERRPAPIRPRRVTTPVLSDDEDVPRYREKEYTGR